MKRPIDTSTAQGSADTVLPAASKLKLSGHAGLSYHDVVKHKPDIPWQEQRDADLQSSVKLWMALVNRWDSNCSLASSTLELADTSRVSGMFAHPFCWQVTCDGEETLLQRDEGVRLLGKSRALLPVLRKGIL